jgi:hypothetical protein
MNPSTTVNNKTYHYDLDSNYNSTAKSAITHKIVLADFFQYAAYCLDCYTSGSIEATIDMKGHLFDVKSYNFSLKGEYFSTTDIRFIKGGWHEDSIFHINIFKVPLFPVNIPGVMCLVPEFRLKLNAKRESWSNIGTIIGMDYRIPIDINLHSDGVNKPHFQSKGRPTARAHPIGDLTFGVKANIGIKTSNTSCPF